MESGTIARNAKAAKLSDPVAAPIKVQPLHTVDFETRLELANVGMDVMLSQVTDQPDETAPVVSAAIDEAAELLSAEAAAPVAFVPNAVLKAAGDIIRARGWMQGSLTGPGGRVCALGAIRAVEASPDDEDLAECELIRRIYATPAWIGLSITGWNDQLDRTKGDVLRLLS